MFLPKFYFNSKCKFFTTYILDIKQEKPFFHDKYTWHKQKD